jgi:hypothetical protein
VNDVHARIVNEPVGKGYLLGRNVISPV